MTVPMSREPSAAEARDVGRTVRRWLRRATPLLLCALLGFFLGGYVMWRALAPGVLYLKANHEVMALRIALRTYRRDFGRYPHDRIVPSGATAELGMDEVLAYSLGRALPLGETHMAGPFMVFGEGNLSDRDGDGFREFLDPWGNPWLYACGGGGTTYVVASAGRDGRLGGKIYPGSGYRPSGPYGSGPGETDNVMCHGPPPAGSEGE